ncbi:MAG: hypothetical protein LBG98_02935 [Puniceicoccales bacterium]|jgi:hypothetical protein|nr:hypothetical protein [Puniceicoccales bacterium]
MPNRYSCLISKFIGIAIWAVCPLSYGCTTTWKDQNSADDFWTEAQMVAATDRSIIERHLNQLGISATDVSYHIWDIYRLNYDAYTISFELPQNFHSTSLCAVKIFHDQNLWEQPYDTDPQPNPLRRISLPNGFLKKNQGSDELNIGYMPNENGFMAITFVPNPTKVLVTLARVWVSNNPLEQFLQRIDPRLKIEDVSGDGNCGFWSVLRSLKNLRDQNPNQTIGNFDTIPDNFSASSPSSADYTLMTELRKKTGQKGQKALIAEAFNSIRWFFVNAFSLQTSLDSVTDSERRTLPMSVTIPPYSAIRLSNINLNQFHELNTLLYSLDTNLYRFELFSRINNNTHTSLSQLQNEATSLFLQETDPVRYQYLMTMPSDNLWLVMTDLKYLAKAIALPLLVVYPKDVDGTFTGEYGCYFFDKKGERVSSTVISDNSNPQCIAELLTTIYPHSVMIYYNGINHYQAIVKN